MKTWKLVSYGDSSENFLLCFHRSKRESRAPKPWYIFGKPLYVPMFFPTVDFGITNPILMDRTLSPNGKIIRNLLGWFKPPRFDIVDQIWTVFFEKEPWKVKQPLEAPKKSRDFENSSFFKPNRVELFSQEYLNYSNITWKRSLILKTRCVLKIFSKPRRMKNSPAIGVMCFGGIIWIRLLAVWIPNQKKT